jgi:hypothetical protein
VRSTKIRAEAAGWGVNPTDCRRRGQPPWSSERMLKVGGAAAWRRGVRRRARVSFARRGWWLVVSGW